MIKIPGTKEGLPAIERCLTDGININITLIFAVERYIEVAHAYLRALRSRVQRGEPVDRMASVASFFVSRVDTKVDKLLDEKIAAAGSDDEKRSLEALKGKAAIANAKIAYQRFQQIFYGDEFADLRAKGARVQRPLWASTSTKNPAYRDVLYVEELIGRDTVDTMPPKTIDAFREHGRVADTLGAGVEEAHEIMRRLAAAGIDMAKVTQELEDEGVESFAKSFATLAHEIEVKQAQFRAESAAQKESAALGGGFQDGVERALDAAQQHRVAERVWQKDATLWKPGTKKDDPEISGWLGWLRAPQVGLDAADDLLKFVDDVRREGFTHTVVLGMGGSSLAPEVFARTFEGGGRRDGYPELLVLDSTDPANVLAIEHAVDLKRTLFIVSSKSGTTTEPNTFHAYFWERVKQAGVAEPGRQFVAITDAGTPLEKLGNEQKFRRVFTNDPEIGGRYSALSFFGLVPAALAGIDIKELLRRAQAMAERCAAGVAPRENPGVWLGTILGELALAGHDKITFLPSSSLASFGLWGEQLLAESTGKEGKGLIPVAGEEPGLPAVYGDDRLFVYIRVCTDHDEALHEAVEALEEFGQPVVRLYLDDVLDLGAEFFRWEFATAVAGAVLGINPFDQPNVQESKDNTKRLLSEFERQGRLAEPEFEAAVCDTQGAEVCRSTANLREFLASVKPGDYLAIMAYLPYEPGIEKALQDARLVLRNRLRVATTLGYGPRFLHSTGQLHKGGPNSGVFVQITAKSDVDAPVPGEKYSFAVLEAAQALGDLQSLQQHGRRVVRLHIEGDVLHALETLGTAALEPTGVR